MKTVQLDQVNRKLTVSTSHFSDWTTALSGLQLHPGRATVAVGKPISLSLVNCIPHADDGEVASLGYACVPSFFTGNASGWAVNGAPGGVSGLGLVAATSGISATYTAPATKPRPNRVAVSAQIVRGAGKTIVVSYVTIVDDQWVGTATATNPGYDASAEIIWKLDHAADNVFTYLQSGTVTVSRFLDCSLNPATSVIEPANGRLVVDYNTTPATYYGLGGSFVTAMMTCPQGSGPVTLPISYFAGNGGPTGLFAAGSVSGDGKVIAGTGTVSGNFVFNWRFTRE